MRKKLNNKGFTLIELLATIVILGIVSTVVVVSVTGYLNNSKKATENAFIMQLEDSIEGYVSLYASKDLKFSLYDESNKYQKCYKEGNSNKCYDVVIYKGMVSGTNNIPTLSVLKSKNIINNELVNPINKKSCDIDNTSLEIYRDSDYVYCFKVNTIDCVDKTNVIDTCSSLYIER